MADARKPQSLITTFLRATLIIAFVANALIGYFWISSEYKRFHEQTTRLKEDYLAQRKSQLKQKIDEAVGYVYIERSKTETRLKATIQARTDEAYAIAMHIYQANRDAKKIPEIQGMVKDALRPIRFNNGRGYYFATAMDGRETLFADRPEMEGRLLLDLKDTHGRPVIRDMIALVRRSQQGFLQYYWTKPKEEGQDFAKIAYIRYFAPFDWLIGTGEYLDDVELDIRSEVFETLSRTQPFDNTYLFAYTYDGRPLFAEGQDKRGAPSIRSWKDANGKALIQAELKIAQGDAGGFVTYTLPSPTGEGASRLIAYVRGIPEWQWVIGGSISLDPIEGVIREQGAALEKQMRGFTLRILLILAGMVAVIYCMALYIAYKTHIGLDLFAQFFEKASSESAKIPLEGLYFSEYQRIAESANRMLDTVNHATGELKRSEGRFRALIEKGHEAITVFDADDIIIYESPSMEYLLGYMPDEMIGKPIYAFLAPDAVAVVRRLLAEVKEAPGRYLTTVCELMHADGSARVFELTCTNHLDDPALKALVANGRDITERMRAEEQLRLMEFSIEHSDDAVYWFDSEARFLYVNEGCVKMWGYSREELLQMRIHDLDPDLDPGQWPSHWEDIRTRVSFVLNARHITKSGTIIPVEVRVNFREFGGKAYNFAIAHDISERRNLEERLQRAQKMEALGLLAGGVAHDLNNILSGIMSYPDLLLMQISPGDPMVAPLETIRKSGEKAAAIVQDLLTLARRGVSATEVVSLNDIVQEYLATPEHARMMEFHPHVRLETRLEQELLPIMGSPLHLSKTLMNLTSNAAEAMLDAGAITIATRNQYLDRPLKGYEDLRPGDYVVLTVSDTGQGISHDDLERIFEPFYTKKVMGRSGTGLGLAVVWGTVKDHQGYIDIETQAGKGTTFSLYFPATREALPRPKAAVTPADFQGRGESILVVDDVSEQRELATHMLLKLGYIVSAVDSGEKAVAYLETHHIDLILLDMIMDPGIDGLETYRRILALHPRQKAVIVSGYAETERVRQAQKLGAGPYVKKPYFIEKLGLAIRAELDGETPYETE